MPLYEFSCQTCKTVSEHLLPIAYDKVVCGVCGNMATRIPSACATITKGNIGPKLRTRVALDDELKRQGISAPLFKSELGKDKARWLLKKEGIR
jgi:putative FmdB family regulatory protein